MEGEKEMSKNDENDECEIHGMMVPTGAAHSLSGHIYSPFTTENGEPLELPESSNLPPKEIEAKKSINFKKYVINRKTKRLENKKIVQKMKTYSIFLPDRYVPIKLLGEGVYGYCVSARDKDRGVDVAIKIINLYQQTFSSKSLRSRRYHKCMLREILILKHFQNHDNIINLRDLFLTNSYGENMKIIPANLDDPFVREDIPTYNFDTLVVVTDLMKCDLFTMIYRKTPFSEKQIKKIMYDCLRGLHFINSAEIFHRDIKAHNILVNKNYNFKICDFGLSRGINHGMKNSILDIISRFYKSPEVLCYYGKSNTQSDIWSIGCVFAELLSGEKGKRSVLFRGSSWLNQIDKIVEIRGNPEEEDIFGIADAKKYIMSLGTCQKIDLKNRYNKKRGEKKLECSSDCFDLLEKMLVYNPFKRITAKQALEHKWFKELYENDEIKECEYFDIRIPETFSREKVRHLMFEMIKKWNIEVNGYNCEEVDHVYCKEEINLKETESR